MSFMRPTFQPQNPALSGYRLGWISCTNFAYAMGCAFHRGVAIVMRGGTLREKTGDHVQGTTLRQNDWAAEAGWGIDLDVRTPVPWEFVQEKMHQGRGVVLQGHGDAFLGTKFFCNATVNHCGFVPPDLAFMDPSADGRYEGIYRFHAEPYPDSLLRKYAGRLQIQGPGQPVRRLGLGYAYAAFTRDMSVEHEAVIRPKAGMRTREFTVYPVDVDAQGHRFISDDPIRRRTEGFAIPCTPPKLVSTRSGEASVSLVKLIHPGHPQDGWWVNSIFEREV